MFRIITQLLEHAKRHINASNMIAILLAAIFVAAILLLAIKFPCDKNELINTGLFIATVGLALIAYIQLKALRAQTSADFLFKFNRDFFDNEANQNIITDIEEGKKLLIANGGTFSDAKLDDFLGYFELMSWYEKKNILDFELIDEMFGHYISMSWKNPEINKYINELRGATKDPRYYKPFEELALGIIQKEKSIRKQE